MKSLQFLSIFNLLLAMNFHLLGVVQIAVVVSISLGVVFAILSGLIKEE
jgi:hypothetical protein